MIVFGSAITKPEVYEACARAGIELAREPNSHVLEHTATGSLPRNYNIMLDKVRELDGVEALVLLHQDSEIVDSAFCAKLRDALSDPDVALVGAVGSIGARSIAWWEGSVTWASFTHRYPPEEFGGGEFPAFAWDFENKPPYAKTGEVDALDGFLLVLSPWAIANIDFDESLGKIHGYDFDACMQARAAGKKLRTADLKIVHHHSLELIGDREAWINAHMRVADKWDGKVGRVGQEGGDLLYRARRAEAEAGALRNQVVSVGLIAQAHAKQLEREIARLTAEVTDLKTSASWRLTQPLRRLRRLASSASRRETG
jgi:GT2 family glycosyltransferase